MKRARLIWTADQKQWLRDEVEVRHGYARMVTSHPDLKRIYEYERDQLIRVQRELDALAHTPETAIWTWWSYWWSACWIVMLADRENPEGMAFRRCITDERNTRLAALPKTLKFFRPVYILNTDTGYQPSKELPYGTY